MRTVVGSAMPVLLGGILSLPMIAVIGFVVRGEAYERAIDTGTLSLADAVNAEIEVFSVGDAIFDASSLIWRDEFS